MKNENGSTIIISEANLNLCKHAVFRSRGAMHNCRRALVIGIIYIHSGRLSGSSPFIPQTLMIFILYFINILQLIKFSKEKFRWRILGTRKVVSAIKRTYLKSLWWPNGKRSTHLKTLLPGYEARERIFIVRRASSQSVPLLSSKFPPPPPLYCQIHLMILWR